MPNFPSEFIPFEPWNASGLNMHGSIEQVQTNQPFRPPPVFGSSAAFEPNSPLHTFSNNPVNNGMIQITRGGCVYFVSFEPKLGNVGGEGLERKSKEMCNRKSYPLG